MPTHRLTAATNAVEEAVWRILAGDDLGATAEAFALQPEELSAAAELYRRAGHHALASQHDSGWQQLYLHFTDWTGADRIAATHLLPILTAAEHRGAIDSWWFMRKHPCWRLRVRPGTGHDVVAELAADLDQLTADGHLQGWWPGVYEAETAAFGGEKAVDAAHRLFAADSKGVVELAAGSAGLGHRELSILLCGALMRDGARLEWYERGDVWDRVTVERPLPAAVPAEKVAAMAQTLRTLLLADTAPDGPIFTDSGPAARHSGWAAEFRDTGRALADANAAGQLHRGLREVLSYHVIFHWNRLGLPAHTQAVLAHAARHAILGPSVLTHSAPHRSAVPSSPGSASAPSDPGAALARFPLIHQGRQHCGDLPSRIALVEEHAANSAAHADPDRRINDAAAAWNLAALIAADCNLPGLAEELSLAQFDLFHQAWPLSGRPAIAALQPLVNLARLTQRTGDPKHAHGILTQIEHAVTEGGTVEAAGLRIPFGAFLDPDGDHGPVKNWLRRTLREDGTRSLVAAGAWDEAAEHAARCDDLPDQMHEARQMRVLAAVHAGRRTEALRLIESATTVHAWHRAVAGCLRVVADAATADVNTLISDVQAARDAAPGPVMTMFRIRLSLVAACLIAPAHERPAELLRMEAARDAEQSGSAYAARDVLADAAARQDPPPNSPTLHDLVVQAGLHGGTISTALRDRLAVATRQAADVLTGSLKSLTPTPR